MGEIFQATISGNLTISHLNIWQSLLSHSTVEAMAAGQSVTHGGIVSWPTIVAAATGPVKKETNCDLFLPGKNRFFA